jgi:hypothetical protein
LCTLFPAQGRPDKDAPGGNEGRPQGIRCSQTQANGLPFATEADAPASRLSAPTPASPAPYFTEARLSAPGTPSSDAAQQMRISAVSKMSVPELRLALRVRGLSPAGGSEALRTRLTEHLEGMPPDVVFAPSALCRMDRPSTAPAAPTPSRRAATIGSDSAGGGRDSLRGLL